jgi:excisionase family DNA binding protein
MSILQINLMTPAEVATLFRVDVKTVTRWAQAGKLASTRTLGGTRRFYDVEVKAHLRGAPLTPQQQGALVAAYAEQAIGS